MCTIRRMRPDHFLKCSRSTDGARAEQVSDPADFINNSIGIRVVHDVTNPTALSQRGQ